MTGGRLKRLQKHLNNETFLMTYGDGVSNIDIKALVNYHKKKKKISNFNRRKTTSKIRFFENQKWESALFQRKI